ncbi:unnamed protein product [Peniophora sp. CBMAI 1063]|nr:unnamed protein product [Peniophora sp. CBMAI 1063]
MGPLYCLLLLGVGIIGPAIAQDLTIPSGWNVSSSDTVSRTEREAYANEAAAALVQNIVSNGSLSDTTESQALASMYTVLALQDTLSGNSTWKNTISNSMKTWVQHIDIFGNGTVGSRRTNSNGIQWALASYYAYKAYGDPYFLNVSQNAFSTTYKDYITPSVAAASQSAPGRNISAVNSSGCFSHAAGGIFWLPDVPDNTQVQADTVGPFAVLAGHLFEETGNTTYQTLGLQSLDFMGDLGWDQGNVMEVGVIDVYPCGRNTGKSPGIQGWYIYALAIFANITSGSDTGTTLTGQLRTAVSTAGRTPSWTQSNGVLIDTQDTAYSLNDDEFDSKAILVRALSETLRRNPSSTGGDLVHFIQSFLTIQYDSVTTAARNGSSYAIAPAGPAPAKFSNEGNIMALDMLNAAFAMAPKDVAVPSSSSTTSPSSTGSSQPSTSSGSPIPSPSHVGAIVGGVVGGIGGLCIMVGVYFWWHHKRRKAEQLATPGESFVEPFFSPTRMVTEPYQPGDPNPQHGNMYRSSFRGPGHRSKLARELPSTPSLPRTIPTSSTNLSDTQSSSLTPMMDQHADLPALVGRLVHDLLRDRDAVSAPPEYGEQ